MDIVSQAWCRQARIEELEAENKKLREALEDLYSMASSPQWRNEPLFRVCVIIEKSLREVSDAG